MTNIRQKQINALKNMFNFNSPHSAKSETTWKVLIYDQIGHDVIAPHFSIKELRDFGITLHLHIDSVREAVCDAPAIYFVYPSTENIERIGSDCSEGLYEKFYLNFISPLSRHNLDVLAAICVKNSCTDIVAKVYDQYLNFIALEDYLVILQNHSISDNSKQKLPLENQFSFYKLNSNSLSDVQMEGLINQYVDNLFSIFITLIQVPVIYYPKTDSAANYIGERLFKKIQTNLRDPKNNLFVASHQGLLLNSSSNFGGDFGGQNLNFTSRACLVLVDRSLDLVTPLTHTWTYQALIQDLFIYDLNKVIIECSDGGKQLKKHYDLNYGRDKFWRTHKGSNFPTVAEAIQTELEAYKSREAEIRQLKHNVSNEGLTNGQEAEQNEMLVDLLSGNTSALSNVVNSLPALLETKKYLDMHTNIATELLSCIKTRKLDQYFELEEKVLAQNPLFNLLNTNTTSSLLSLSSNTEFASTFSQLLAISSDLNSPQSVGDNKSGNKQIADMKRFLLIIFLALSTQPENFDKFLNTLLGSPEITSQTNSSAIEHAAQSLRVDLLSKSNPSELKSLFAWLRAFKHSGGAASLLMAESETLSQQSQTASQQQGFARKIGMFSKLVSQGSHFVMEGVQNFIVKEHKVPVTRLVDKLVITPARNAGTTSPSNPGMSLGGFDAKSFANLPRNLSSALNLNSAGVDKGNSSNASGAKNTAEFAASSYVAVDPKQLTKEIAANSTATGVTIGSSTTFNNIYVCVIGGGSLAEFQNLQDYIANQNAKSGIPQNASSGGKRITYIASDLCSPTQFLEQLIALSTETSA